MSFANFAGYLENIQTNKNEFDSFKKETSDKFSSLHTQFESGLNDIKSLQLDILKMVNEKLVQLEQAKQAPSDIFTKERMKNYHIEFTAEQRLKTIETAVNYIKSQVLSKLPSSPYQAIGEQNVQILTKFVYKMSGCNEEHLDEILKKVCEIFPDSKVMMDPMKSYIFIDWS
jgi:hypothetical protein